MKNAVLSVAVLTVLGVSGMSAISTQAANLNTGDTLTITAGVPQLDSNGNQINVSSGSWYGLDFPPNGNISGLDKAVLSQGTSGLVIGVATSLGASHNGCPVAGDTNAIDAPYCFLGTTASDYLVIAATGGTTGINLSGWRMTYNGLNPGVDLSGGAWGTGFSNGIANFTWDGVYGDAYTLDYRATVPPGDPSGLGGISYALHLEGFVQVAPVPVPAAIWLLGSGLVGLMRVTRRRKNVA